MIQRAKFGSYLPSDYVGRTGGLGCSRGCCPGSKILHMSKGKQNRFFPRHESSCQTSIQSNLLSPVHCPFCTLPTDATTFKKLRGLFGDAIFQRSCPKGRVQSFNSDHCSYSSSDQTPAPTSSSSRPRPPRVAGPDYCTWSNLSSRLRNIVAFSSFCC